MPDLVSLANPIRLSALILGRLFFWNSLTTHPIDIALRIMIDKYLHTLEYTKILDQLEPFAAFSASKDLVQNLKPSPDFNEVTLWQTETAQARHLLTLKPGLGVGGAKDVRPFIAQADRAIPLMPQNLLSIQRVLVIARDLHRTITKLEDQFPLLADIAYRLTENSGLINQISLCIDDAGEVRDSASPELARIRRDINIAHNRLMERLRRLVASERYQQYLQENIITQRDGRYVVPLKADFKGRIRGVVHGQSGSGATLFVEPMAVVELNNQWRQLQSEEDEEITRILLALSGEVANQGEFIATTVQALAELDLILAKARYAESIKAIQPTLLEWADYDSEQNTRLVLKSARHPLLEVEHVVPITLSLTQAASLLIITGPNTGGKTVTLKTVGLFAMMTQAGLPLPAQEAQQVVFDGIYADIGDEQSLEQSLSTFSSHMTNIVTILDNCTDQSLVIFDELGAGTDPLEGAALAQAILKRLLNQKTTTFVATHFAELKAFAYTTPGVTNASMEFDLETLSPTYRLQMGLPGSSNAFIIASRLGLSNTVVETAQSLLSTDSQATENMLAQIGEELKTAQYERLRLEEERAEAEYDRKKANEARQTVTVEKERILEETRQTAEKELTATQAEIRRLKQEALRAITAIKAQAEQKKIAFTNGPN